MHATSNEENGRPGWLRRVGLADRSRSACAALLVGLCASAGIGHAAGNEPAAGARVGTTSGEVEGLADGEVLVFRGLPYAAAPVDERRWKAPEPVPEWSGVRPAKDFGKACSQRRDLSIDQAGDPGPTDEDCLFLNVWTPRTDPAARLPVMVWIHGGAFVIGAGSQKLYDGAALARGGAVVVTLNYRLGALGFFAHPALDKAEPGGSVNFGLLDQIAALRWVQDNIAAFGGDPRNVTIFGESAGAQSVLALFTSPLARRLFAKGIAQSAYGIPSHTRAKAQASSVAVANALGLDGADATLAQLRSVPAERFAQLEGAGLSLSPSLIVGDAVLPQPILTAFQQGREAALPLIIGNNSDEASVAVAFGVDPAELIRRLGAARVAVKPLYPDQQDDARLGREVMRDAVFTAYARRIAYLHSTRSPTWRYYFSRVPEALRDPSHTGVPHGGEIADVFGADEACGCLAAPRTEADRRAAQRVGGYWLAFARDGAPDPRSDIEWPRDGRDEPQTMVFGETFGVEQDFMRRRLNAFIGALNVLGWFTERR